MKTVDKLVLIYLHSKITLSFLSASNINIMPKCRNWDWVKLPYTKSESFNAVIKYVEQFHILFWPHIQTSIFKPQWYICTVGAWQQHRNGTIVTAAIVDKFTTHQLINIASDSTTISTRHGRWLYVMTEAVRHDKHDKIHLHIHHSMSAYNWPPNLTLCLQLC